MPLGVSGKTRSPGYMDVADSVTFNAPGTFTAPTRLRTLTVTGRGGDGNPGNPGTAGAGGAAGTKGTAGAAGNKGNAGNNGGGGGEPRSTRKYWSPRK